MSYLNLVKNECEKRLRFFKSLLRRHDPSGMYPVAVQECYQRWDAELSNALNSVEESISNMIIVHKAAMSTDDINLWEQNIVESETKYRDHNAAAFEVIKSGRTQAVPTTLFPFFSVLLFPCPFFSFPFPLSLTPYFLSLQLFPEPFKKILMVCWGCDSESSVHLWSDA